MNKTKPFIIPKGLVMQAFKLVKENAGGAGVDQQSITDFETDLKNNLYKLWNKLSSGSYFPPAVKAVPIPKKAGGVRILGVPTVSDRIAQMVVKLFFEPLVEKHFHPDSYGYRPKKSALDAVGITRQRCWKYDWVLEFDIKGLFDNIDHELLMKAVRKHTDTKWVILYIERWLKAPMQMADKTVVARTKGTPQGGVISPVLSNLFLHYVFDNWMQKQYPQQKWCRYADDGLVHGTSEKQMQELHAALTQRFNKCGLELHPDKTKIVYCKGESREEKYPIKEFTFLGYTFRARRAKNSRNNTIFASFTPAASKQAMKSMRARIRKEGVRKRTDLELEDIAEKYNPVLRGWIEYYGCYTPSALGPVLQHFNQTLVSWIMRKYKKFVGKKTKAHLLLKKICSREPQLFAHWKLKVGVA